jgi:hypothetical protein
MIKLLHHLQEFGSLAPSALKHEAYLMIMSNSDFTWAGYQPVIKHPYFGTPGFSFKFPSLRLLPMANEYCLLATWEGAFTRCYPPGQQDLELAWGRVTTPCSRAVSCGSSNLLPLDEITYVYKLTNLNKKYIYMYMFWTLWPILMELDEYLLPHVTVTLIGVKGHISYRP